MKPVRVLLLSMMAFGPLLSCMDDQVAGNTTQTENSVMSIRVDSVLPVWNRGCCAPTVVTLRLDSSNFKFHGTDSAGKDLAVQTVDGDSIPFHIVDWDKGARLGRLQVRIGWPLRAPGARFLLRWREPPRARSNTVAVWHGISDSQRLALTSVLVDDFEGSSLKSRLPDSASWYSAATDSTVLLSKPTLVAAGGTRTGKAVHMTYTASSSNGKYALIGIVLGTGATSRSFRSLDSTVVWVRGSGKLSVAFDRLLPGNKAKSWIHFTLDSNWVRLRIRPQDMDSADNIGNNLGWDSVRDAVTNLSFLVSDGSDLYVDDVKFYGVDRDDLY